MSSCSPCVSLREIAADTVRAIIGMPLADSQKSFLAPNATSLAQTLFAPEAWYRAIYLGEAPLGFLMLEDQSIRPEPPIASKRDNSAGPK